MNKAIKSQFSIIIIILLATILRIWGINFGLPQIQFIDEGGEIGAAFFSIVNGLKPLRYQYAPLLPYILIIEYSAYYSVGKILNIFSSPLDFYNQYIKDPTTLVLIGRLTSALAGVATVWIVYLVGKKIKNKLVGLLAALFLAVNFIHTKESHYIKQDILSTFFLMGSFYFVVLISFSGKLKDYLKSGIFAGLALATKYQAIYILPAILFSHFINKKRKALYLLSLFGSVLLTFVLVNPHSINVGEFISRTLKEFTAQNVYYPAHLAGKSTSWWYFVEYLPNGIGYLIFALGLLGFGLCLMLIKKTPHYMLLTVLPAVFFITSPWWLFNHFARYTVMLMPFFVISAALLLEMLLEKVSLLKSRHWLLFIAGIVLVWQPFWHTIKFNYILTQPDTRKLGTSWIEKYIPDGTTIYVEQTLKPEYPTNTNVLLGLHKESIENRLLDTYERDLPGIYLNALLKANEEKKTYRIIAGTRRDMQLDILSGQQTRLVNAKYYVETKAKFLVLSSWTILDEIDPDFEKSILDYYNLVKIFKPFPEFPDDPHFFRFDYHVLDQIKIYNQNMIFGPEIKIFQLKDKFT